MTTLTAYLIFDGTCGEAMRFYADKLRGQLEISTFAESPGGDKMPADAGGRIMHARLTFDGQTLMASDCPPGQPGEGFKGVSLALATPTVAEGRALFEAMSAGGHVTMPFDKTFWAEGFGMFVDRFGVAWMVNVDAPA